VLETDRAVTIILMLLYSGNLAMGTVTRLRAGVLPVELEFPIFSLHHDALCSFQMERYLHVNLKTIFNP
jgi:hypothetical protein